MLLLIIKECFLKKNEGFSKPVLLIDCDGVLLNWFSKIPDFLSSKGINGDHVLPFILKNDLTSLEFLFPSASSEASEALFLEYNHSDYMADLSIMEPGADTILERISHFFDLIVITNISSSIEAHNLRTENLIRRYGDIFKKVICLQPHTDKSDVISEYVKNHNVSLWIDNSLTHVNEGISVGAPSFQYVYRMESGIGLDVPKFGSWKEIEAHLLPDVNKKTA